MTSRASERVRRSPRRRYRWYVVGAVVLLLAGIGAAIPAFFKIEQWRGERAWEAYQDQVRADGTMPDPATLQGPAVADADNFAMTPLLQHFYGDAAGNFSTDWVARKTRLFPEFFDLWPGFGANGTIDLAGWRTFAKTAEIQRGLADFGPEMDEFTAATRRPGVRFPSQMEAPGMTEIPTWLLHFTDLYMLRATLEMSAGHYDAAGDDATTLLRAAAAFQKGATLTCMMSSYSLAGRAEQLIAVGLVTHAWTDAQLAGFEDGFGRLDPLAAAVRGLRVEQANANEHFSMALAAQAAGQKTHYFLEDDTSLPRGWIYQNQVRLNHLYDSWVAAVDLAKHRLDPGILFTVHDQQDRYVTKPYPYVMMINAGVVSAGLILEQAAVAQAQEGLAMVACGLERYRLVNGSWPKTLDELVPKYLAAMPQAPATGDPPKYDVTGAEKYTLFVPAPDKQYAKDDDVRWTYPDSLGVAIQP